MRIRVVALVLVEAFLSVYPSTVSAQPGPVGAEVAFGAGVTLPAGTLGVRGPYNDVTGEGDVFSPGVPLALDAGLRIGRLFIGAAFQYALLLGCGSGHSCADPSSGVQVGGAARFYLLPDQAWDPWLGAGVGYELETDGFGAQYSGWNSDLRAGADFRANPTTSVGPFLSVSLGEYTHDSHDSAFEGGLHEWFTLGVRVVWDPR